MPQIHELICEFLAYFFQLIFNNTQLLSKFESNTYYVMNKDIRNIAPKTVWNHFADLNAVPRPSKKEERIIQFMVDFGNSLNLETMVDKVGNVIIKKPATSGMENRKAIVMQGHIDMVHQKNADTLFDFDKEGIKMYIDGDWVKAEGTTLGADNGLGVAAIMAVLSSTDIPNPAIEALFTIDEETGMTGAMGLEANVLKGEILLNLDTEDDDEFSIGCAGGIDLTATKMYTPNTASGTALQITIKGLQGGHSGMQIHEGLGNANKLMNRIFKATEPYMNISSVMGGGLRNAIPRESNSVIVTEDIENFNTAFETIREEIITEYISIERDIEITVQGSELIAHAINGKEVLSYSNPTLDEKHQNLLSLYGDTTMHSGFIAIQAENSTVQFKSIEIMPLGYVPSEKED